MTRWESKSYPIYCLIRQPWFASVATTDEQNKIIYRSELVASPLRRANAACVVAKMMRWRVNGKDTWTWFRNNFETSATFTTQSHPHRRYNSWSDIECVFYARIHTSLFYPFTTYAQVIEVQARAHAHAIVANDHEPNVDESIQCIFI